MASDVEVCMKQRGVTEFLHVEKMAPTDIHQHFVNVDGDQTVAVSTSTMSQARRSPRRVLLPRYPDGAPEEQTYGSLLAAPDTAEQMELNISSAVQVGHQLALIGDEFNRAYSRKIEDTLLHLAHRVAISVFQTWNIIRSVTRSFGNFLNNNWTKRIADYGSWVCRLPFRCVCQKLVPAALLAVAFWWAISYGLQN